MYQVDHRIVWTKVVRNSAWIVAFAVATFMLVVLASIGSYAYHRRYHHVPSLMDTHMTTLYNPKYHAFLLALMRDMDHEARRLDCEYWTTGGTLLGLARFDGIMPFDDDIDVCMMQDTMERFMQLVNSDASSPLLLTKIEHIVQLRYRDPVKHQTLNHVHIDVLPMRNEFSDVAFPARVCVGAIGLTRVLWPKEWYYKDDVLPLKRVLLNDVETWAPCSPNPYLDRTYSGWRETIYLTHVHSDHLAGLFFRLFKSNQPIHVTPQLTLDMRQLVANTKVYEPASEFPPTAPTAPIAPNAPTAPTANATI